jgi:hypothetical protein
MTVFVIGKLTHVKHDLLQNNGVLVMLSFYGDNGIVRNMEPPIPIFFVLVDILHLLSYEQLVSSLFITSRDNLCLFL